MFTSWQAMGCRWLGARMNNEWKRNVPRILATLGVAVALAGCEPVQSVYPFFDSKDVIFEPQLVGDWREVKGDKNSTLTITRLSEQSNQYVARYAFQDGSAGDEVEFRFQGYLFEINGAPYLDLLPKRILTKPSGETVDWEIDTGLFTAPTHTLYRVWLERDRLELAYLDDDRVRQFVNEKNLKVATDSPAHFLLTAPTQELQSEILAHCEEEKLLDTDNSEFVRER
jgi:hypothetical protein